MRVDVLFSAGLYNGEQGAPADAGVLEALLHQPRELARAGHAR